MSRTYRIGEEKMVSVTTAIGDYDTGGLMQWAANCAVNNLVEQINSREGVVKGDGTVSVPLELDKAKYAYKEISKEATDIGTEVHDLVEQHIKAHLAGTPFITTSYSKPEVQQCYAAFLEWEAEANPVYVSPEKTVHSDTHKYAGTLDLACELNGKSFIVDFKTSKAHYNKNAVQLAAYKMAYEEMTGLTVEGVAVLRLDKVTGEYDWKDYTKVVDRQWQTFLGLLQAWNFYKKRRL